MQVHSSRSGLGCSCAKYKATLNKIHSLSFIGLHILELGLQMCWDQLATSQVSRFPSLLGVKLKSLHSQRA